MNNDTILLIVIAVESLCIVALSLGWLQSSRRAKKIYRETCAQLSELRTEHERQAVRLRGFRTERDALYTHMQTMGVDWSGYYVDALRPVDSIESPPPPENPDWLKDRGVNQRPRNIDSDSGFKVKSAGEKA